MKVEAVTLRELRMPLKYFFETSFGRSESRRVLLVTAHCEGADGWAECVAGDGPFFSYEWIETAWATIRDFLAPALISVNLAAANESNALMSHVRGHNMAKAALENALWDAEAKQKRQPLWKLLGGKLREINCGVSIGIQDSPEQLLSKIEGELAAGYRRIKIKVKPGWDVDILARIRNRWPGILLSCDANSAYRPTDLDHLRKFDDFNLLMIEQPLWHDDIFQHAKLQRLLKTSICLDESIRTVRDAEEAIELTPAASSISRSDGSAGSAKPLPFTTSVSAMAFRCGAAACSKPALDARTTSRFLPSRTSACPVMSPHPNAIGRRTSSILKLKSVHEERFP